MNPVLRRISKQFGKGAAPAQEFGLPWDLHIVTDIPYRNHENIPLAMDVYRLKNDGKEAMPVILMVHGGGLLVGSRKMTRIVCEALARAGYLVIAPQYRSLAEIARRAIFFTLSD